MWGDTVKGGKARKKGGALEKEEFGCFSGVTNLWVHWNFSMVSPNLDTTDRLSDKDMCFWCSSAFLFFHVSVGINVL